MGISRTVQPVVSFCVVCAVCAVCAVRLFRLLDAIGKICVVVNEYCCIYRCGVGHGRHRVRKEMGARY